MMRVLILGLLANLLLTGCGFEFEQNPFPTEEQEVESESSPPVAATPFKTATEESMQPALKPTAMPAMATETFEAPAVTATIVDDSVEVSSGANADVIFVSARLADAGSWTFAVTVQHPDSGWEDYADGWDVVLPNGTVVKPDPDSPFTRLLLHPHVNEQPFTRSQANIRIPGGIGQVTVRAHDLVDGYGGREVIVDLDADNGQDFEVIR